MRVQGETLDTLKEGVAVFGSDGRLKLANRAFADMWRLAPESLAEQSAYRRDRPAWPPARAPRRTPGSRSAARWPGLPTCAWACRCRMERRDGSVLDCAAAPLPDGATLLTFIDVTASVNVERALTERNDALERASRLRDDFVHHVSYELRSPLTNVIGFTQLLGDGRSGRSIRASGICRAHHALVGGAAGDHQRHSRSRLDRHRRAGAALETGRHPLDHRGGGARACEDRLAEASLTLDIDAPADIGSFGRRRQARAADPVQPAVQRGRLLSRGPDDPRRGAQARRARSSSR